MVLPTSWQHAYVNKLRLYPEKTCWPPPASSAPPHACASPISATPFKTDARIQVGCVGTLLARYLPASPLPSLPFPSPPLPLFLSPLASTWKPTRISPPTISPGPSSAGRAATLAPTLPLRGPPTTPFFVERNLHLSSVFGFANPVLPLVGRLPTSQPQLLLGATD